MGILGISDGNPADWLPLVEKYGVGTVALIVLTVLLYRNSAENKAFLLGLISNMTTRIRDLEGDDRNKLLETCDKAGDAMERQNKLTEQGLIQQNQTNHILQQCSTQLTESARLMERLKRSRTFQSLPPDLPPEKKS